MLHRIRRCTIQAPFQVRSLALFGLVSAEASLRFARRLRRVPFRYSTLMTDENDIDRTFARLVEAARHQDGAAFKAATQDYAQSAEGQAWLQSGHDRYQQIKANLQARAQAAQSPPGGSSSGPSSGP
ncbi:hypothetical protein LA76x_2452 [Lysobacter antibioticus]|uniref:Uncharacterized protein n=1 Tax=Lysobacter antibioticus TaxID=84531 RepID=A0A0S2FAP1_LYSAN|nr:hypothetical protein LA76x_2452 [Lysobacter antibioticus]